MTDESGVPETVAAAPATLGSWPGVSVVMPVLDEENHLRESVDMVLAQDYPGEMEVILAVAPSRDGTERVAAQIASHDSRVRLVENADRTTPAGLNLAIRLSRHPVVVRVDGHGVLSDGYIRRAVQVLDEVGADNVGGIMDAEGRTPFERAVARAMRSPFGLGGGSFHTGGEAGPADTVYLGVFRRETLERLGGYDEHFRRAQDWELNYRIRRSGGLVWFTPDLRVTYRPRSTWIALVKQFFRTGRWRREVIRRYPDTVNLRYLAPPVAVVALSVGIVAGLVTVFGGPDWLGLGWLAPAGYALGILVTAGVESRGLGWRSRTWLPAVLATMHLAWGAGFLRGPERVQ